MLLDVLMVLTFQATTSNNQDRQQEPAKYVTCG